MYSNLPQSTFSSTRYPYPSKLLNTPPNFLTPFFYVRYSYVYYTPIYLFSSCPSRMEIKLCSTPNVRNAEWHIVTRRSSSGAVLPKLNRLTVSRWDKILLNLKASNSAIKLRINALPGIYAPEETVKLRRGSLTAAWSNEAFMIYQMIYITCKKCRTISSSSKKFSEIKSSEI